jgi:hypothetical protein
LARHMSDPFVSNMLLHSCTLYIEGCALEYYIQQDQAEYFLVKDAGQERARDEEERKLERECWRGSVGLISRCRWIMIGWGEQTVRRMVAVRRSTLFLMGGQFG